MRLQLDRLGHRPASRCSSASCRRCSSASAPARTPRSSSPRAGRCRGGWPACRWWRRRSAATRRTGSPQQVRKYGVAGNWQWWAFVLTGVATVFFFARLWRRSGVMTDLEFYELRYSGKAASRRPRLPRGLSRAVLQLLHHGHGDAGGVQDRQHPLRPAAVADDRHLRRAQRRVRGALRAVGRARHRHDAVLHQDDGGDRGGVLLR